MIKNEKDIQKLIAISLTDLLSNSVRTKNFLNHVMQYCKYVSNKEDVDFVLNSMDDLILADVFNKHKFSIKNIDKSLKIKDVILNKFDNYRNEITA